MVVSDPCTESQLPFCRSSIEVSIPSPVLPQWHVKDPGHSAKSAGGRLHLNTHTPLAQRSQNGLTMPLSRHSVGSYQETSSHVTRKGTLGHSRLRLAEPLWTDPGLKSGISIRELISTLKKKNAGKERIVEHPPKNLAREEKATTITTIEDRKPKVWRNG